MTLVQLKYIVAVDTYHHFATAAEKCFVTQPTLSMQIHKLEEELGVVIFDRSKQPVVTTPIGSKIVDQARLVLKESSQISDIVDQSKDIYSGTFRVGIIPTVAPYLVPRFLRNFTEKYPNIHLIFEEAITTNILDKIVHDQLDAGIIATTPEPGNIREIPLYHEPFVGYISNTHQLARRKKISINDLESDEMWLLNEGHCLRDQVLNICKKVMSNTAKKQVQFESGNLETLKKLVQQNFGMTLLPYLAISPDDEQNGAVTRAFTHPEPQRIIRLIHGRLYLKKPVIDIFVNEILDTIPQELKKKKSNILVA